MSFVFRDRILGAERESITSLAVPGQWVLEASGDVWHNREPARTLDYLLPDGRQGWSVQDDETRRVGRFDPALLPSERDIARILDIGKELTNHLEQPSAWDGLTQVSPVMRNLDERARLQRLERDIERGLGPLKHVCKRPRLHLHSEQERVPTARARRIPSQATSYLAAHSEDWEVRTVRGVRPKRLLATVTEDLWDIYENRVAVRLVDHLLRDVSRRIAEVREVWRLYDRALQELSTRAEGTHWRQQRLFRLWGRQLEDAEQGSRIAQETLDTLEQLRRELLGLRDSRLYGAIPVRAQVPGTLRRTNILLNDPHYREVARLWRRRERAAQDRKLSPTEQLERQREFHVAFEAFGVLLTCRALKDFGFVPRDGEVPRRGRPPLRLSADNGRILEFEWQQGGDWVLREHGNNTWLRFVSMPASPGTQGSPEAIARLIDLAGPPAAAGAPSTRKSMRRASSRPNASGAPGGEQLVLLYLGQGEDERISPAQQHQLNRLGFERGRSEPDAYGLLPISAADLGSEERVARALRWWLTGSLLQRYAPRIPGPRALLDPLSEHARRYLEREGEGVLRMVRAPRAEERTWREFLQGLSLPAGAGRSGPPSRQEVEELTRVLAEGTRFFEQLLCCPVCPREAQDLQRLGADCYRIQCPGCEARWGVESCGSCGERIPFLWASGGRLETLQRGPGWLDRFFGRDVLASPCWGEQSKGFICPGCRACPNEGKDSRQCARCRG